MDPCLSTELPPLAPRAQARAAICFTCLPLARVNKAANQLLRFAFVRVEELCFFFYVSFSFFFLFVSFLPPCSGNVNTWFIVKTHRGPTAQTGYGLHRKKRAFLLTHTRHFTPSPRSVHFICKWSEGLRQGGYTPLCAPLSFNWRWVVVVVVRWGGFSMKGARWSHCLNFSRLCLTSAFPLLPDNKSHFITN